MVSASKLTPAVEEWLASIEEAAQQQLDAARQAVNAVARLRAFHADMQDPVDPSTQDEIRQGAVEILRGSLEPMHRKDIFNALVDRGLHVGGKDPINNLGAILSRNGADFESYGNGMWGLMT